jgi:drug/metabolite transporter (DMT)-like permease
MTGVLWAVVAGVGFGLFQSFNRRAGRGIDAYWSTFILILVSAVILAIASVLTEDLNLLRTAPLKAYVNFGLAGFIHFFVGWTFLSISQKLVGASRTGALVGAAPLFAFIVGILVFGEFLSLAVILGIVLVIAGVYLVSNG